MTVPFLRRARDLNATVRIACYGLYAPLNAEYLKSLGVDAVFGGEFEDDLLQWALGGESVPNSEIPKLSFRTPDRTGLPSLGRYAKLRVLGEERAVGYTEASRGCKHRCRHCPVVPVYDGAFRVVGREVVLADIRQQVEAGAAHITFGDPDFWNGPAHATRILEAMHAEFAQLTFDATIKVEHLRQHRHLLPLLKETGCQFVTSAVESLDDEVLAKLEKGHTRADFLAVVQDFREIGLPLSPTFIAFHPWTTLDGYREFLRAIRDLDLVANVAPVQLALRLLIPQGSRMLELDGVQSLIAGFDPAALTFRWSHPDAAVERLSHEVFQAVAGAGEDVSRQVSFAKVWELAHGWESPVLINRSAIPYLTEPWFC